MKKRVLTVLLVLLVVVGAIFAVNAADAQDKAGLTLSANQTEPLSISEDTVLDLNGHDVTAGITVADGANLYIKDSSNGNGKITGTITGNFMSVKNYVPLKINGAYSFRQGDFALENAAYLRTKDIYSEGASVYFKGNIGADNDVIAENVAAHGVAMRLADGEYFADGKAGGETFTSYTGWVSSDDNEINKLNSVELTGIMRRGNSAAINNRNAEYVVYCAPYVEMANGERLLGEEIRCSLKQLIEQVNAGWDNADWVTYDHKATMVTFNQAFPGVLPKWNTIGRINSLIDPVANTQENPFSIQDADDLVLASKASVKNFRLDKDIDMSAVKDWKPFTTFSGTFNGNNKKISNLTITGTSYATSVGFIGINNGTVTNLHLRDVEVIVPSDSVATAVGTIAGTNNGSVTGVTATGTVTSTADNAKVGALIGKSTGTVTPAKTITDSISVYQLKNGVGSYGISDTPTTYTTSNLSAIVGLYTEGENVTKGLVAEGGVTGATSVYWRDTSYSTERQSKSLQAKREKVVQEMYNSGTYRWTPAENFTHSSKTSTHTKTFNAGLTYVGTPYDHRSTPYAMAMDFAEKDSKDPSRYLMDVSEYVTEWSNNYDNPNMTKTYPYDGYTRFISSDCSSACIVAWHQVSPVILNSNKKNGGVSPEWTSTLVASEVNQWYYGVRPVGYTVDDEALNVDIAVKKKDGKPVLDAEGKEIPLYYNASYVGSTMYNYYGEYKDTPVYKVTTDAIAKALGAEKVYEAYAQTRMGDVLNSGGDGATGGHSRMVAQDPVVIRNGENNIDPAKSFFLTHEQGDGLYDFGTQAKNFEDGTRSSWRINYKYTFKELSWIGLSQIEQAVIKYTAKATYGYYLPVTMDALNKDVSYATVAASSSYAYSPEDTAINSVDRILSARLIIREYDESTGKAGEEVYTKTFYKSGINEAYGCTSMTSHYRNAPGAATIYSKHFIAKEDYAGALTEGQTYIYDYAVRTFKDLGTETYLSNVMPDGYKNTQGSVIADYIFTHTAS